MLRGVGRRECCEARDAPEAVLLRSPGLRDQGCLGDRECFGRRGCCAALDAEVHWGYRGARDSEAGAGMLRITELSGRPGILWSPGCWGAGILRSPGCSVGGGTS